MLNANLKKELQNLRWRIQCGRSKIWIKFVFYFLIRYIEFWNSVIGFRFNDPKNLNNKITKLIERLFFIIVRQNKYNFLLLVTIKLFYFIHILYILEPTISIFLFFEFSPIILATWPPFWIHHFKFFIFEICIRIGWIHKWTLKEIVLVLFMKSLFWILIKNCAKRICFIPKCRVFTSWDVLPRLNRFLKLYCWKIILRISPSHSSRSYKLIWRKEI